MNMQDHKREQLARQILNEVRKIYHAWQSAHTLEDYPSAETLFALPLPQVMRWFLHIAANLRAHNIHPQMQALLLKAVWELEALGFRADQED